jgi:predicted ATPase
MKKTKFCENLLQIPLKLESLPEPNLKEGITNSNEVSLNALEHFITSKNKTCKSFFLWGQKGSGKTYWLKAWQK